MAVGPDVDYVVVNDAEGRPTILAEARLAAYADAHGDSAGTRRKAFGWPA